MEAMSIVRLKEDPWIQFSFENTMYTFVSNAGRTGKFFHICQSFMGCEQYPPNWIAMKM
jgi:hypothetical protein